MLSLLINKFKKLLTSLIMASLIIASFTTISQAVDKDYIKFYIGETKQVSQMRQCDIVVRAGEYQGKCGKRIYVNNQTLNIPNDIPIRNDNDGKGFYISEWDINVKEAKALVEKLRARGINATLQIAYSKSEDLNAAGRIANKSNPYIYVSLHHNYYDETSRGYFAMYNPGDTKGEELAARLTNAIRNKAVPQRGNVINDGYIGELNSINSTTTPVLLELGFFSNIDELEIICSNRYVDYISTQLANELTKTLKSQY